MLQVGAMKQIARYLAWTRDGVHGLARKDRVREAPRLRGDGRGTSLTDGTVKVDEGVTRLCHGPGNLKRLFRLGAAAADRDRRMKTVRKK